MSTTKYGIKKATMERYREAFRQDPTPERWGYLMAQLANTYRAHVWMYKE